MSDCHSYPRILCSIAEEICHDYAIKNTKAVGKIAADDDWFEYQTIITHYKILKNIDFVNQKKSFTFVPSILHEQTTAKARSKSVG